MELKELSDRTDRRFTNMKIEMYALQEAIWSEREEIYKEGGSALSRADEVAKQDSLTIDALRDRLAVLVESNKGKDEYIAQLHKTIREERKVHGQELKRLAVPNYWKIMERKLT
jgi:hypothetical protein